MDKKVRKDPKEAWTQKEKIFKLKDNPQTEYINTPYGSVECRECLDYKGWIAYLQIGGKEYRGYGRTKEFAYRMAAQDAERQNGNDEFL